MSNDDIGTNQPVEPIGYVNRYRGRDGAIWSGRTIFPAIVDARSCPCASRDAYVDTCALIPAREPE